ncbi:MAG: hypothetical protein V2J24_23175 [Pseudomonadales bacterium]|nr:hypothetical protein [Pseudomonadales bacterium]
MLKRLATALLGAFGLLYIALSLLGDGASMSAELPGAVIGVVICVPFVVYGLLGAERFACVLPPFAFLVEDPQDRDVSDEQGD